MTDKQSSKQRRSNGKGPKPSDAAAGGGGRAGASAREAEAKAALAAERAAKRAEAKEARKAGLDDDVDDVGRAGGPAEAQKANKPDPEAGKGRGKAGRLNPRARPEREEHTRKQAARSGNPRKAAQAQEEPSRYTAPIPSSVRASPWWVPALMFACFGLGILIIFFNYIEFPFGAAVTWRTLLGLGFILVGIMTATQYH